MWSVNQKGKLCSIDFVIWKRNITDLDNVISYMESYEVRNPGVYLVARLNINRTNLAANSNSLLL